MKSISFGILAFLAISVASARAADSGKPALANMAIADAASGDGDGSAVAQSDDSQPALATGVPKRLSPLAGTDAEAWASVPRWSHARSNVHPKTRRSGP
jgi:hypothetical protein